MGFIVFLIIGGLAGWAASTYMNKEQGIFKNVIVGVVGALIGGWLGGAVGITSDKFIGDVIIATVGAVILLWALGKMKS